MTLPMRAIRAQTHRLINSRFPTIGVFDEFVDDEEELRIAFELEQATNPRLHATIGALSLLPEGSILTGHSASIGMAAFIHVGADGSRFNDGRLGAWYCALNIKTAIAETLYHNERRLRASETGFPNRIQLRELIVKIDSELLDLRGAQDSHSDIYDPNDYHASQAFANDIRWPFHDPGIDGIIFDSVRRENGENICLFRPQAMPLPIMQGSHYQYEWNQKGDVTIAKLEGVVSA